MNYLKIANWYLDITIHYRQYEKAQQNLCTDVEVWF